MVRVRVRNRIKVRVRIRFRSKICKLRMLNFELVQRILQIAQTVKSCATTITLSLTGVMLSFFNF